MTESAGPPAEDARRAGAIVGRFTPSGMPGHPGFPIRVVPVPSYTHQKTFGCLRIDFGPNRYRLTTPKGWTRDAD